MKNNNIEITGKGWLTLIDKAQAIADKLDYAEIVSISREYGMLKIKFAPALDKYDQYVLDSISYKLERDSVRVCEECGAHAIRRKDLEIMQPLCTKCYTLKYNEFMESASPQVTNQEPQS